MKYNQLFYSKHNGRDRTVKVGREIVKDARCFIAAGISSYIGHAFTVIPVAELSFRCCLWLCRTKELSPSDSGQLSPVGSSSNPSPPDDTGSPVGTSADSTTFLDAYIPGGRPVDGTIRPPPPHNMAPVGVMNMQQPFTHQLPFVHSPGGHHLSLFSDSGFVSSRQPKPAFDQRITGK